VSPLENADSLDRMLHAHERATRRTGERIAEAGVDHLERSIRRRTPIDTNPYRHRPDRPRGSLKRSVHRLVGVRFVLRGGRESWEGEVVSFDPVARLVEFDTPPHTIRARDGGKLHFQSRDGWTDTDGVFHPPGTWVTIEEVHHPGTKGQHMFSLGALDTEAQIDDYAREPLGRWKRDVEGGRF
jgi:hypothetical protein